MKPLRITLSIGILLIVTACFLVLHQEKNKKSAGLSSGAENSANEKSADAGKTVASKSPRPPSLPLGQRVLTKIGDQIVLKIYADQTFTLHLPDSSDEIFVRSGEPLFSLSGSDAPHGVKIKIRTSEVRS